MTNASATFRMPLRMQAVQSPVIPIVADWIRRNPGTISLGQGVVSYGPPPAAFDKLKEFQTDPDHHKYKTVTGLPPLVEALERKVERENGIAMNDARALIVTAGANMAFMNAVLAVTDPGDEVILLTPYYFNHEMAVTMAGCRAVLVATDKNFQPRPEAIAQAITPHTRAVVTISPNNPTGAVYPESLLRRVNEICHERGIHHIHDEAYEYFIHGRTAHFSPGSIHGGEDLTLSLYSLSKAYGFASWRIGYMVAPRHLVESIRKIQDTILICPPVISQFAAWGAVETGVDYCREYIRQLGGVRESVLRSLGALDGLCDVPPAEGAFYFFLRLRARKDAMELTRQLIERHRVAVMPGSTFGMNADCYLRVAYGALSRQTVEEGMERLISGLQELAGS